MKWTEEVSEVRCDEEKGWADEWEGDWRAYLLGSKKNTRERQVVTRE